MKGVMIRKVSGKVVVLTEEKSPEKIKAYLEELKERLDTTMYGLCPLFNLTANDNGCRQLRRWYSDKGVEMPEHHWRALLTYIHGLPAVEAC